MEDTSMTKLLTACLFATACATTVEPGSVPIDDGDDGMSTGSDSGSGSGSADETPTGSPISLATSTIRDERGDSIDFATGEPVHTHAGNTIDLATPGCPSVYKYGYLMDVDRPYGDEKTANPLAWHVQLADPSLAAGARFRVRAATGQVHLDWSVLPSVDAAGMATIELTRNGGAHEVPELGAPGQYFLDVSVREPSGHETIASYCWDLHPLAAPVEVEPVAKGELFSINLPANTPSSRLIDGSAIGLVSQTITQQVAAQTTVTWSPAVGTMSFSTATFDGYVTEYRDDNVLCLNGTTDPKCAMSWTAPALPGMQGIGVAGMTPPLSIAVVDVAAGTTIQTISVAGTGTPSITVSLPPRGIGQPPHAYRFELRAVTTDFRPDSLGGAFGDYSLLGLPFAGQPPQQVGISCANSIQTQWGPNCKRVAYHYRVSALDRATLQINAVTRVEQGGNVAQYVPAGALSSGTLVWDSGDDDLPGEY
jgi:hypothetical protein